MPNVFKLIDQAKEDPVMWHPDLYTGVQAFSATALDHHTPYVFFLAIWAELQRRAWDEALTPSERSVWDRRARQVNAIMQAERDEGRT